MGVSKLKCKRLLALTTGVGIMAAPLPAAGGDGWPLRNGDFSRNEFPGTRMERPDWKVSGPRGHKSTLEGDVLVIQSAGSGRYAVYQDLRLPPGLYTFRVEARTTRGALLVLHVADGRSSRQAEGWFEAATEFSVPKLESVRAHLLSVRPGELRLRQARIDVRSLVAAPLPLEDGRRLGAIALPDEPTEAEQFAAWELQRFLHRMTGLTPGLTGRDETRDGVCIRLGRAAGPAALARLAGRPPDSYLIAARGEDLLLAGNNDRGTLYAAYDFLRQQGCGWYSPGPAGEVVPQRNVDRKSVV